MSLRVGIVGCGSWGMNYLRVLHELRGVSVAAAADLSRERLAQVRERFPHVNVVVRPEDVLDDPALDAVILATPASLHLEHVRRALEAGKHVLVEKPLALEAAHCDELAERARAAKRVLMVDHTFVYNDSVRRLRELVRDPAFGRVYYLTARRNNLGPIREDVSALWDLAPHDLSIFDHLLGEAPVEAAATAGAFLKPGRWDAAFLTLRYASGALGHVQVSWVEPFKVREVVAVGDRRRVVFDDVDVSEPLRVFERGVGLEDASRSYGEFKYLIRDGDILSPRVHAREPLRNACQDFLDCVASGREPVSGAALGRRVVAVLAACDASIRKGGAPVEVAR